MGTTGAVRRGKMNVPQWRSIIRTMSNDLDTDLLEDIVRSYNALYPKEPSEKNDEEDTEYNEPSEEKDAEDDELKWKLKFLDITDQETDDIKTARRLKTIFTNENLHNYKGDRLADVVDQFIQSEIEFRNNFDNTVFIGREQDVKDVCENFISSEDIFGINIWGLGGQGKSSFAKAVCTQMIDDGWAVLKVDLRLVANVTDMVKAILVSSKITCPQYDDRRHLMEMMQAMLEKFTAKTLFFFDNCDKMLDSDKIGLTRFLEMCFGEARTTRKVLFLLTSRQKLLTSRSMFPNRSKTRFTTDSKLLGLAEFQLPSLPEPDAVLLFKAVAEKDDIEDRLVLEIVLTCGCSPHAVSVAASLVKDGRYTPERLLAHLKLDEKNISKALHMSDLLKEAIDSLESELQKALIKLSVFPNTQFNLQSACRVLAIPTSEQKEAKEILHELHQKHLIECENKQGSISENKQGSISDHSSDKKLYFSLHPLVHRYLCEWRKPSPLEQASNDAIRSFMDLYEEKINKVVKKMDTKCMKGIEMLQEHRSHIIQFYDILHDKHELLKPYPRKVGSKEVLSMKRVSDLTDLLLSDVKKRRIFQSEADRAKRTGCDAMYVFWMVEKADVLLLLHDRPELAVEILDDLTNGKFAALRGLHANSFYPPIVHALFHKVKGLVFWKQDHHETALKHMELSLQFYKKRESRVYDHLMARMHCYIGQIYLDKEDLDRAERSFTTGYRMILGLDPVEEGDNRDVELDETVPEKQKLQWDVPLYFAYFGKIKLKKALLDPVHREKLLDKAQQDLMEGMALDRQLKLERLDNYCMKQKLLADVFAEKGVIVEALRYAEEALEHRRAIIQPPHFKYVESVYQVARLFMLKGNQQLADGKEEDAMDSWITSNSYFGELQRHHLINGSVKMDHPLVKKIKSDHMDTTKKTGQLQDMKKVAKFYKDLYAGCYQPEAKSILKNFKEMMWTPVEMVKQAFGAGGDEFGEHDHIIEHLEVEARDQMDDMVQAAVGGGDGRRRDSGMGHSSSDIGDSLSSGESGSYGGSGSQGGSLGVNMERLRLEKSISLEDNVFTASTEVPASAKPEKKRQKTIDE